MARPVKYRIRKGVAIVTLATPPANAISADLRAGLWDVFGRIEEDQEARAAILIAEGGLFSGGADIRSFDAPEVAPRLSEVCRRIETSRVPVVAGLDGAALGAGADLALACHFRLAAPGAALGLPEVTLGLVPSGGATQRLPRLMGAGPAIDLMLSGRTVSAATAREAGLLDGIVSGHLHSGTWSYAKVLADRDADPHPVMARTKVFRDGPGYLAAVESARAMVAGGRLEAPRRIIDCVEAALLLPAETGLAFEADAAESCRVTSQSNALRHAFIAENRISARLLRREDGKRVATDPAGAAVVSRLRHVIGAVAEFLRGRGLSPEMIDTSLIDYGFTRVPYDGTTGGAGPKGEEIARRFVFALMVEGARQLADAKVDRASDIDALAIHCAGFPRFRGGPMRAAELHGLLAVRRDLDAWSADSALWTPPTLLAEAVKTAAGFNGIRPAA